MKKISLDEISNLRGHWAQMNLDGYCEAFWKKGKI